ncbi:MAG: MFS transporter [Actinomycetota bacterium]|nr:MFS transporter [Actinomycetota bacterium]
MFSNAVIRRPRPGGEGVVRRAARPWQAVAAATFAIAWGGNEFTPLLVMYRGQTGFSPLTVDLLLFAYVFGIVPALLIGGALSDRLGRRALMLPAPLLAAAGSTILALGQDSALTLAVGRVFSGLALGLAMAVGGSWIKELSGPPWDDGGGGARRAAMSLTAGFGLGAGVAGMLAQWAPAPTVLPYVVNVVLALAAAAVLTAVPETRERLTVVRPHWRDVWADLAVPVRLRRRFLCVVVPVAPWVFGAGASAYAVLPALMAERAAAAPIAFSGLLCVVTLGVGFTVQHLARRMGGGPRTALVLLVAGMATAAWAATALTIASALLAAAVLGAGYGMAMLAGLQEIQRMAGPDDLAGLTAVFYSVSYLGFAVPAALAFLVGRSPDLLSYPVMFVVGALAALACLLVVVLGSRRGRQ